MTGSEADAEDLSQETLIHACQHLAEFRAEAKLSSWLYRIAVNQCLNWQKRQTRQDRLRREWSEQALSQVSNDNGFAQLVWEALNQLDPKQRAAVVLTTYEGLNHAEAARILGCSEATVSWRVFAARRKLKKLLKVLQPKGGNP